MTRRQPARDTAPDQDDTAPEPATAPATVRVACKGIVHEFHALGHVITTTGTDVPADDVAPLQAAAAASGVSLTTSTEGA